MVNGGLSITFPYVVCKDISVFRVCLFFAVKEKSSTFAAKFENEKFYFMTKALKIVVLAKQVPDTRNVGKKTKP